MNERRFTRVSLDFNANLKINETLFSECKIIDLSIGGCFLECSPDVELQTPCEVVIPLGDSSEAIMIFVKGVIIHSMPEKVSIMFTEITPENLHHLQNLIRYNAADPDLIDEEINKRCGLF